ncbi:MAG: MFS transporter [Deinococcota bacterium]
MTTNTGKAATSSSPTPTGMKPTGMKTFVIIWLGQVVSLVGTAMGQFALTIWVWQETGQATSLALMGFFTFAPMVILSPLAGALVDRLDRKLVMMLSDLGAGVASIGIVLLLSTDALALWHLYALAVWTSAFAAFQFPAYSAAISSMVSKTQYARASGMLSIAEFGSGIAAPVLAGGLLAVVGIRGVLLVDIVTFVIALLTLVVVHVPNPLPNEHKPLSFRQDVTFGFTYIFKHKPLFAVQLVFFAVNLLSSFSFFMVPALVLARTSSNELVLASVQFAMGLGGLTGGLLLTWWGGPKTKIHGVLTSMAIYAVFGSVLMGISRQPSLWMVAGFAIMATISVMNGSNQALWQSKVPLHLQGRVFAARRLIAQLSGPPAIVAAGLLADNVFEPVMQSGGTLADQLSWLVGVGPGAGIALMCVIAGVLQFIIIMIAYTTPRITQVETLLPDHDAI